MMRLLLSILMWAVGTVMAATPQLPITVLYKKDTSTSAGRLDPAVQSALQAFDESLLEAGFRVIQPEPKMYELLDRAQGVVVTFSADAGYSLLLDLVKSKRPYSGTELTYAEVRIRARVYHGRNILVSTNELGAVAFRNTGAEDKAFEAAARRAATKAVGTLAERLPVTLPPQIQVPSLIVNTDVPVPPESDLISPGGRKWALMVGIQDFSNIRKTGQGNPNDLAGVTTDMKTVHKALTDLGVEPARMIWLYNEKATTRGVREALQQLKESTAPDDLVYVYLSTHGIPKEGGLSRFGIPVTYDFRRDDFIDFEQFRGAIAAMPATNIVWLNDTCHSGLAAEGIVTVEIGSRDFGIAPASAFDASAAADLKNKNIAVLSSATSEQKAADMGPKGGLFSYVFSTGVELARGARQSLPGIYGFFKEYVDGKVQAGFRELCAERPVRDPALCAQGGQQPVFASQRDGKLLRM